jgi:FSR family fosmidomycin resistance protein-like MFS transporter
MFDKFRVLLLALGHFTVDVYANLLPPLLPIFQATYNLTYAAVASLTAVFSITSTLIQPVFGYVADRYGKKWIAALGVAWVAVGMCLLGVAQGYGAILVVVGLAGFGSAMFHPQASAMVPKVSGTRKGLGISLFMAGGNIGYSIMPLIAVVIVTVFGISSLVWLIPPGIVVALLMYFYSPRMDVDRKSTLDLRALFASFRDVKRPLTILVTMVSLRAWVTMGLITFIPLYFYGHFKGWTMFGWDMGLIATSVTLFLYIIAEAIGGIIGGWAADRFGMKPVIVWTLLAAAPFVYLTFATPDLLVWPLIMIGGALTYASVAPTTLQAQELLPRSQGMAGGLVLGFANGIGGLLVLVNGVITDYFGLFAGVESLVIILVAAGLLATLLPGDTLKVGVPKPAPDN